MFKKLDVKLPTVDLHRLQGEGRSVGNTFSEFREYEIKDINYLYGILKNIVKFHIPPSSTNITIIEKNGASVPHTDVWPTALNFYLDIQGNGGEVTTFYDNPSKHKKIFNLVPGLFFYDISQLIEKDSFIAHVNDCYLLDTHTPHTVSNYFSGSRTLLRCVWLDIPYDTVLHSIKVL